MFLLARTRPLYYSSGHKSHDGGVKSPIGNAVVADEIIASIGENAPADAIGVQNSLFCFRSAGDDYLRHAIPEEWRD